ncbi:uncharacterized protein J4E79_003782 [Alternaria viburni]|uniref:uncharacterized protein n=1 Tax=Alternaria viburni TaxID=566460 RepID=UPI0020C48F06|nr:uncharacterized protein J4E79_003782 [Alternaria viburni]KAI4664279.1 hypothetical protein J4E79_003782 [Alternaria viburni]
MCKSCRIPGNAPQEVRFDKSTSVSVLKDDAAKEQAINTPPTTFQSWLFGVLSGGQDSWIMNYMNSEFYDIARNAIKERTGGRDVQILIMTCAALNAARVQLPVILSALLNQVKPQVTSSITISGYDSVLCGGLLTLAREKAEESRKLRRFRGEHQLRAVTGELSLIAGETAGSFWHKGRQYMLEIQRSGTAEKSELERLRTNDFFTSLPDPSGSITVRCWGHSRQPITELFEDVQKQVLESTQLTVVEMGAHGDKKSKRNKRPLSSIDLDPKMMQDITQDIEMFFHKDSQAWYENSGRPYRHGYLFAGPPGTGKSSLLAGIASHMNVPLYIINLQGMDDYDLREAFSRVPFRSCIGLEDIDCVGVDVGNRGAQNSDAQLGPKSQSPGSGDTEGKPEMNALETMLAQFMEKQSVANYRVLNQVKAIKAATLEVLGEPEDFANATDPKKTTKDSEITDSTPKSVTLSGLLNVIDGVNATEGRIIIMTTNHPEKLDPALYRAGRVERKFDISYASKASSIMTFKRLFDNDVCKRYTSEAIHRFALAFQAQFPSKSRITTAELAKYCGQYRGRPDIAVREFADWLQRGAEKFSCPVDYANLIDEEGIYNVPESFDDELLQVSADDLVDPITAVASGIEVAAKIQGDHRKSGLWNPFKAINTLLLNSGDHTDLESIEASLSGANTYTEHTIELSADPLHNRSLLELRHTDTETCHIGEPFPEPLAFGITFDPLDSSLHSRNAQISENRISPGLATPQLGYSSVLYPSPIYDLSPGYEDSECSDDTEPLLKSYVSTVEASSVSSNESAWDEAHHNQASPIRSVASVKFSEPGKLALASPRPIVTDSVASEHERHDSAVEDSDTDEFDTAEE